MTGYQKNHTRHIGEWPNLANKGYAINDHVIYTYNTFSITPTLLTFRTRLAVATRETLLTSRVFWVPT